MSEMPSPTEEHAWLEDAEELPVRPRRRLLTPVPLALFAALAIACGFIAGVLVEKGQGGSAAGAGEAEAFASRLAGARGARSLGGAGRQGLFSGSSSASGSAGGGSARQRAGAAATGAPGAATTIGQVAYVSGSTLYVRTAEGNTVEVTLAPGASVTKTVTTHVRGIHPGETVLVTGSARSSGAIAARAIRVGGAGSAALGGLLGAGAGAPGSQAGTRAGGGSSGSSGAAGGPGEGGGQALFGKGG